MTTPGGGDGESMGMLRVLIAEDGRFSGGDSLVTVSAGVAVVEDNLGVACRVADDALYLAKEARRDRVVTAPIPQERAA
jgi:PleD family two-component response regulator